MPETQVYAGFIRGFLKFNFYGTGSPGLGFN